MFFQQLFAFVTYFTRISYHDRNNSILIHRLIFICLWSKTFFLIMWFREPHIQYPSFTILLEFNIRYFSICRQIIISSSHRKRNSFALTSIDNCINNSIMPANQENKDLKNNLFRFNYKYTWNYLSYNNNNFITLTNN